MKHFGTITELSSLTTNSLTANSATTGLLTTVTGNFSQSLTVSGIPVQLSAVNAQDHGALIGLADDDHTQYTLANGTRAFTGSQSLGGNNITNVGQITATTVTGTAVQVGTSVSAQSGAFSHSLTISGASVVLGKPSWRTYNIPVSGTAAQVNILDITIPANTLKSDGVLEFGAYGDYNNTTGNARTFNCTIFFGNNGQNIIYADTTAAINEAASKHAFAIEGKLYNISSTARQRLHANMELSGGTTSTGIGDMSNNRHFTISSNVIQVDTTQAQRFRVAINHSIADPTLFMDINMSEAMIR